MSDAKEEPLLKRRVAARLQALGTTPIMAAGSVHLERNFIDDIIKGKKTSVRGANLTKVAEALHCSVDYLINENAPPPKSDGDRPARGYPRIGKVGAGGEGLYEDDYAQGAAQDYIDPLPGMSAEDQVIVLDIDGDSMIPAVFDGDLAFFGPIRRDVDALLNKRVMARLADGRKYFKILKRGAEPGLFTLRSLNPAFPDIEDVQVEWVLPYRGSRPVGVG